MQGGVVHHLQARQAKHHEPSDHVAAAIFIGGHDNHVRPLAGQGRLEIIEFRHHGYTVHHIAGNQAVVADQAENLQAVVAPVADQVDGLGGDRPGPQNKRPSVQRRKRGQLRVEASPGQGAAHQKGRTYGEDAPADLEPLLGIVQHGADNEGSPRSEGGVGNH